MPRFELLIRRHQPDYRRRSGCSTSPSSSSSAMVPSCVPRRPSRSRSTGEVLHTAADGNGPVNALDQALRKALRAFYPELDSVHLVDYKVRILDGDAATAAKTRVLIESSSPAATWSTVGSRHQHHRGLLAGPRRFTRVRALEG